jgi:uncharacterized membrane protein YccC
MIDHNLSEAEWALVAELLQREQDELPVEIHHCRVSAYREELRKRLNLVHGLLERLQTPVAA